MTTENTKEVPASKEGTKDQIELVQVDAKTIDGLLKLTHDLHKAVQASTDKAIQRDEKLEQMIDDIIQGRTYIKKEQVLQDSLAGRYDVGRAFDTKYHWQGEWKDHTSGLEQFNRGFVSASDDMEIRAFQQAADDLYIISQLLGVRDPAKMRTLKTYKRMKEQMDRLGKAMSIISGAAGADWIPTGFSGELIELVHLNLTVAKLHVRRNFPLKVGTWKRPGATSDTLAYRTTAANSDSAAKFRASHRGTTSITFEAEKMAVRTLYATELDEDAIIEMMPMLKLNMAEAIARAVDDNIINGDVDCATASSAIDLTDMHGDTPTTESPAACWDGYRVRYVDEGQTIVNAAGAVSDSHLVDMRAQLGKRAVSTSGLAYVTSVNGYLKGLLKISDLRTVDKYGPKALILSGELAKHGGIPIVVSEQARDDLSATAVSGGKSGNADATLLLVHRPSFELAEKRDITIEVDKIIGSDQFEVVATWRGDFQPLYATSDYLVSAAKNPA